MEESRTTKRVYGDIEEIADETQINFENFKKTDQISDFRWDHGLKKEWEDLKKSLSNYPIFVRTCSRPDRIRAVVIGPPNTPYEDGLFFFDIYLPSNYPASPPKIHHRSSMQESSSQHDRGVPDFKHLMRSMDGKTHSISDALFTIHKSLFSSPFANNTKRAQSLHNREVDKYRSLDPTKSLNCHKTHNIDHMQQNILEPWYKTAFLYTCKKMIADLRDPPADFRDFVLGHFRERSHNILWKLQANLSNMSIVKENMSKDHENMSKVKVILGYSYDMFVLFEHLYRAFAANGSYVEHFSGFLNAKRLEIRLEQATLSDEDNINNGFMWRLKKNFVNCVQGRS